MEYSAIHSLCYIKILLAKIVWENSTSFKKKAKHAATLKILFLEAIHIEPGAYLYKKDRNIIYTTYVLLLSTLTEFYL